MYGKNTYFYIKPLLDLFHRIYIEFNQELYTFLLRNSASTNYENKNLLYIMRNRQLDICLQIKYKCIY